MSSEASAQVDVGQVVSRLRSEGNSTKDIASLVQGLSRRNDGKMRLFVTGPSRCTDASGLTELRAGLFAWTADAERIGDFVAAHPDYRVHWNPPRHLLLDRAIRSVRADVVQSTRSLTGRNVVVGIIDTGVDVRHPDLRRADGTSRVAWLLDLSKSTTGKHPDIEEQFNCGDKDSPCAVYSGTEIDELVSNDIAGDEPRDDFGHGTHVASLAAGNGLSTIPPKYVGIAPEATLVVVRATREDDGIVMDPDIVLGTEFIFEMAKRMNLPAVVNLSLGSDFGAHDGTSEIERELSRLVDDDTHGRAIVVAAGNSGSLYQSPDWSYVEPLGIHTTVHVPKKGKAKVPLLIGKSALPTIKSQFDVWIASRPFDYLSVGLDTEKGEWIRPVAMGSHVIKAKGDMRALIQNGVTDSDKPETVDHSGAVVTVEANFERDTVLTLTLEGQGTASIWVQPNGGIDPAVNMAGVLMPGAQREGTINVPASSPNLIAVGATLDRTQWTDVDGQSHEPQLGFGAEAVEGEVAFFSSAGPNAIDGLKPDLVAPGAYIAGAMSNLADPRTMAGKLGMFAGQDVCESETCLLMDGKHALSMGTSMASPVVAGAVALMLQEDPTLSQKEILRLLKAGAKNLLGHYASSSQTGAGALDVEGALLALHDRALGSRVSGSRSYLTLGAGFIRPDPNWPVACAVHLRDSADRAVDVDVSRLSLRIERGMVRSDLVRKGPGYYECEISGVSDSGGEMLTAEVLVDGKVTCRQDIEIAVDVGNVRSAAVAGSGCTVTSTAAERGGVVSALSLLLIAARRRSRRGSHQRENRSNRSSCTR